MKIYEMTCKLEDAKLNQNAACEQKLASEAALKALVEEREQYDRRLVQVNHESREVQCVREALQANLTTSCNCLDSQTETTCLMVHHVCLKQDHAKKPKACHYFGFYCA